MKSISQYLGSAYAHLVQEVKAFTLSQIPADVQAVLGVLTSNTFTTDIAGETVKFSYDVATGNIAVVLSGTGNDISITINPTQLGAGTTWATVLATLEADLIKLFGEGAPIIGFILSHYSLLTAIIAALPK